MLTLVVHSREDIALAKARAPHARLITAPDAACYLGNALLHEWQEDAGPHGLMVGCGSDAAMAYDALCVGLRDVCVRAPQALMVKLQAIAKAQGARLHEDYPRDAVDMRSPEWEKQSAR